MSSRAHPLLTALNDPTTTSPYNDAYMYTDTFTDSTGHEWRLPAISTGLIDDMKEQIDVDFDVVLIDHVRFMELLFNVRTIGKVLWFLLEKQAEALTLTPRDFAYRIDGPTAEAASTALMESLADFSPRSKVGQWLKTSLRAITDHVDCLVVEALEKRLADLPASSA